MSREPIFEVTSAAANAAARRLTTAAKVQAVLFGGAATDTALIEAMIDRVSARAARHCNLAKDASGTVPTFGRETCRATWPVRGGACDEVLFLPWRVPVTLISSVVEDGVTLSATDYRLKGGAILERLSDDVPTPWSRAKIVVTYVAGWQLEAADQVPPDLEAAIIDQVRTMYQTRTRDQTLLSEQVPGIYSATYGVAGGHGISEDGLLAHVEAALAEYRARTIL